MPPATTICASPHWLACAPRTTALRPLPQTLFTVMAGIESGRPAPIAAWRPGFCPRPALTTFPMTTSSTLSGATPARFTASATTMLPSLVAGRGESVPRNLPMGVRTALTMTGLSIGRLRSRNIPAGSTRRPPHVAAAEEVEMKMEDALAGPAPGVRDDPVPARRDPLARREVLAHEEHPAEEPGVGLDRLADGGDVPHRHDEDVGRRLRAHVVERDDLVVAMRDPRRDLPLDDVAEDALAHRILSREAPTARSFSSIGSYPRSR